MQIKHFLLSASLVTTVAAVAKTDTPVYLD